MKKVQHRSALIAVAAFVAGIISMAPMVSAEQRPGPPQVWEAIDNLQQQIDNIQLIPGPQGEQGIPGNDGQDGLHCWDLDGDGIEDLEEDINGDGLLDAQDCKGPQGDQGPPGGEADISALEAQIADLTARVEALEASDDAGPDVDDDSDGFTENQGDCDDTKPLVNPGAVEIHDGLDNDCDGIVDGSGAADIYEPNNSLAEAADIGDIQEGSASIVINPNMHATTDEDWYIVNVLQSDEAQNIIVRLTNIPAGSNYDIFVALKYGAVTAVDSSTESGNADELVGHELVCAGSFCENLLTLEIPANETGVLEIEVRNVSDTASAQEYQLTVNIF